mmetsp:Transcript_7385/g.20103  ORF Transcript_7385/g.20103 Transcript_7385/m.20103 type:complete len:106 (-) Transcript_7385:322-639(-)
MPQKVSTSLFAAPRDRIMPPPPSAPSPGGGRGAAVGGAPPPTQCAGGAANAGPASGGGGSFPGALPGPHGEPLPRVKSVQRFGSMPKVDSFCELLHNIFESLDDP